MHHEPAAAADVGHGHVAPMRLDQAAHDGQAQAAPGLLAGCTRGLAAKRHLKDAWQVGVGDAATRIADRDPATGLVTATGDPHGALVRGVPDGVAQQVGYYPGELRLAAQHGGPVTGAGYQLDALDG